MNLPAIPPEERPFLDAILANPDDDEPRLVYADWLEERGDERAEWLRAEVAVRRAETGKLARRERDRLGKLWKKFREWRYTVSRAPVLNCSEGIGPLRSCGQVWIDLDPPNPVSNCRPCKKCGLNVTFTRRGILDAPFCIDEVVQDRDRPSTMADIRRDYALRRRRGQWYDTDQETDG